MSQEKPFFFKFFVPGFTVGLGVVLLLLAVVRVVDTEAFLKRAQRTPGKVLESHSGVLAWSAWISVEFFDTEGVVRTAKFETGGDTTRHKKGDSVILLYDPGDMSTVFVGNPRLRRYPMSGIYFILSGGLIFFTLRRLREDKSWE